MAALLNGVLSEETQKIILNSKLFVVGAGGIGCELLKSLVMSGFKNISIIDLDTIDVSNLNRQFLFHKKHVGRSKASVAAESARKFNPEVKIKEYHDTIINTDFDKDFFSQFDVVLNALDNRSARNHVNRMCLAADVPLVESGTAGYEGQVELIKKGMTKCYECEMKTGDKSYPSCTIRNTPSEPIHCIVWAKHLFNQLFGEPDIDEEVSPDAEDPELAGEQKTDAGGDKMDNGESAVARKSTRAWAKESGYDAVLLIKKFFQDDIQYLLTMEKLWEKRMAPKPLDLDSIQNEVVDLTDSLKDMNILTIAECIELFKNAVGNLKKELDKQGEDAVLTWDKDHKASMDFVSACSNIRAHVFDIEKTSPFNVKAMAGRIIPAIATTNAIIAGTVVLRAFQVLEKRFDRCSTVYLRKQPNHNGYILNPERELIPPNPQCFICGNDPEVTVACNLEKMTVKEFEDGVIKKSLFMVAPDAIHMDTSQIIISSEEGEIDHGDKTLHDVGVRNGHRLKVDDFLQNYKLTVILKHYVAAKDTPEFKLEMDKDVSLGPTAGPSKESNGVSKEAENDDDFMIIDDAVSENLPSGSKRKGSPEKMNVSPPKKRLREADIEIID